MSVGFLTNGQFSLSTVKLTFQVLLSLIVGVMLCSVLMFLIECKLYIYSIPKCFIILFSFSFALRELFHADNDEHCTIMEYFLLHVLVLSHCEQTSSTYFLLSSLVSFISPVVLIFLC